MKFLESDLETILHSTDQEELRERGLDIFNYNKIYRQLNLGGYGIADLITIKLFTYPHKEIAVTVYELKQDKISTSTLLQAAGYVRGLQMLRKKYNLRDWHVSYRVCLIGRAIDTVDNFCYTTNLFWNLTLFTYSYEFDGISFEEHNDFHLLNHAFPAQSAELFNKSIKNNTKRRIVDNSNDLPF